MARFLQDFFSYSVEMPKAFLERGQIKEEVEGNFPVKAEPMNGKIFSYIVM